MTTNSQLSTTELKTKQKQTKQMTRTGIDTEIEITWGEKEGWRMGKRYREEDG